MQTEIENEKKDRVLKTLAVGGFIGLIVIIGWLGMQLINFLPNAFTSLASLAESVHTYEPVELVVTSNRTIANAGEVFSLAWNIPKQAGEFTFSYECTDGVAIEITTVTGEIASVACASTFTLGKVSGTDISISSEKNRLTEVPYTITFVPTNTQEASAAEKNSISVLNNVIGAPIATATTTPVITTPEPAPTPTPKPPVIATTTKPVATTTPAKPAPKPVYVQTYTYAVPVSNPAGYTDLGITFLGAGTIDSANRFINVGTLDNDTKGAIQIQIKNTGTKTSNPFTFTIALPNGSTYASGEQAALKPNERSVITLGFDATNQIGIKTFKGIVTIVGNTNAANDTFTAAVNIVD